MNTGIITSFVVSGILLLAILAMNLNISQSSSELTMRQVNQQNVNTVAELLSYDFPKIGYKQLSAMAINNPIISDARANRIKFQADIDNNGSAGVVEWFYDTSSPVNKGSNPDDYILYRTVDGNQMALTFGVTSFNLSYFDEDRNAITAPVSSSNLEDIRFIQVNLTMETRELLGQRGGGGEYITSPWQKTFAPKNLSN